MFRKFSLLFLLIVIFVLAGCNDVKKVDIKNIPFSILDQGDFTLEPLALAAPKPFIAAYDTQKEFDAAYSKIRKDAKPFIIDWEKEFVILAIRGRKGSCKKAGLSVTKISQRKDIVSLNVLIDQGQTEIEKCDTIMNPYILIKVQQDQFIDYHNLTYKLLDTNNDSIAEDTFSIIPAFLR